jgi:lipopolysaccharide export LptBFGC system permease protein LptF
MCKWQMDDPEARVKSSLSDCTWMEDLSMDLSSRQLRTYEAKRTEEHLYYIFLLLFYFFLTFLSFFFFLLYSSFFPYFSFLLIIIFHFFLLLLRNFFQHNTYITFVRDDVMTPRPCLNDARPRA